MKKLIQQLPPLKAPLGPNQDLINIKAYTTGIISPWMEVGTHFENTLSRRVTICDALKDLQVLMPRLDIESIVKNVRR